MSILSEIIENAKRFEVSDWMLETDQDSDEPVPEVEIAVRISVPYGLISEEDWYALDDGVEDPETGTAFYNFDFDGDDDCHWGRFKIHTRGSDIPIVLDILSQEIQDMRDWLTTLSGRDNAKA